MGWKRYRSDNGESADAATPENGPSQVSNLRGPRAIIGRSVKLEGELTGREDLTIDGTVEGRIVLTDHELTIGPNGRVTAEIRAKSVIVAGQVIGNITTDDKLEIAATGIVRGDIRAPRVAIADGAKFKGSIDMERKAAPSRVTVAAPAAELPRAARSV